MKIPEIAKDKIKICGRTTSCMDPVSFVWTGSYIELNVKASELKILVAGPYDTFENWIAIEINGEIISRRMIGKEKEWITVFRMMNKENTVNVRIFKEGQAFSSDANHRIEFYEIETDGELCEVKDEPVKIEFIGDSINSAEGCIGAGCEMDWIAQFFSHTNSYPYMVGKMLDADTRVFSQSGWGVYASWDCNCDCAIPKYYEDICSLMPQGFFDKTGFYDKWDFGKWQPDAIVINLGTNDDGAFHNNDCATPSVLRMDEDSYIEEDRIKVRDAIVKFIGIVRKNNPCAKVYWAYGILGEPMKDTICEAIEIYIKDTKDSNVKYLALPDTKDDEFGSRCHPGVKSHKKAAAVIAAAIKDDLKL